MSVRKVSLLVLLPVMLTVARAAPDDPAPVPITLPQAIEMAVTNNLDVALVREGVVASAAGVLQARGQFDPAVSAGYNLGEDTRTLDAESSTAAGGLDRVRTETKGGNIGVSGTMPLSTRYSADIQNQASADTFNDFVEENVSRATVSLAQPLLEGRGYDLATTGWRIARRNLHISWIDFRLQIESVLLEVERAYWDLIRARRDLTVRRKSVEAARSLLEQVQAKVDVDTAAEAELVQARSGLAQREIALIEAERAVDLQDRLLKNLIVADLVAARAPFEPVDAALLQPLVPDFQRVLRDALANRPELDQADMRTANAEDQLNQTRNERLPQLDIEGSYGINGLGGSFGESLRNGSDAEDNVWNVGLVYRKPWPDRSNRGALQQQESTLRQAHLQAEKSLRQIVLEVGEVHDRLRTSADQIQASQVASDYAGLALENEKTRFNVQKSTVYDLLLRETDLLQAELTRYQAEAEYRKNEAHLAKVRGTLLERWHIELVEDGTQVIQAPPPGAPEEGPDGDAHASP